MPPPSRSQLIAEWAGVWNAGLTRYLRRRLPGRIDPEDLAQEVYVRLLRVEQLEQIKEPQAYLYRVASNVEFLREDENIEVRADDDGWVIRRR